MAGWWQRIQNKLDRWTDWLGALERAGGPSKFAPHAAASPIPGPEFGMSEGDWLGGQGPERMLACVEDMASSRKLRLFGCACCRSLLLRYDHPWARKAVALSEQFADRLATESELEEAHSRALWDGSGDAPSVARLELTRPISSLTAGREAFNVSLVMAEITGPLTALSGGDTAYHERACQANLLRCLFGNPFRPLPPEAPWLAGPDARALALGIYVDHAFDRLPILADALEEAGCDNADVLSHCREARVHGRGCWVVDAVLGKE